MVKLRAFPLLFTAILLCAAGARADLLVPMEEWQADVNHWDKLSDRACAGDEPAWQKLDNAAQFDPVAQVAMAWLITTKTCAHFTGNEAAAFALNQRAAIYGYPIAISNLGFRLLTGRGTDKDADTALHQIDRAIKGGHGKAAATLALHLAQGIHLPRDLDMARSYLDTAEDMGVDPNLLDRAWDAYEAAIAD
jgi:TPR repeat protein